MTSILVVSEKYWPYGGAELAIHCILKILSEEGFDITVLTGSSNIERLSSVKYIVHPSLGALRWPKIQLWKNLLIQRHKFDQYIKEHDVVYIPRIAYPLIPEVRKYGKVAIVHLMDYQPISYDATIPYPYEDWKKKRLRNEMLWNFYVNRYDSLKRVLVASILTPLNRLSRRWVSEANYIICESQRQAQIIASEFPEVKDKLTVIPDPLPHIPFVKGKGVEPMFLYLGGDELIKGIEMLIEPSVIRFLKLNKIKVIVAKVQRKLWKSLFKKLNYKYDNIFIVSDRLPHGKVIELHSKVAALLFPSIIEEPLPSVILESMLAGTIPIASRVGGVPEIVQGTYAENMLFTPGSVEELIDRMEAVLLLSGEQLIDIGMRLREVTLKRFDSKLIRKKLVEVFSR
jgi:glycosyltransferase involved in cell wall biosynthesis